MRSAVYRTFVGSTRPFAPANVVIKQAVIRGQKSAKYLLKPNIKGSTRERRSYHRLSDNVRTYHSSVELYQPYLRKTDQAVLEKFQNNQLVPENGGQITEVQKNIGLSHFLKNVYLGTGVGFAGALGTSLLLSPFVTISAPFLFGSLAVGMVGAFGSILVFQKTEPTYEKRMYKMVDPKTRNEVLVPILTPVYQQSKYVSAAALAASMGLMMSPAVMMAGPAIVAQAVVISTAVMAGSTLYALKAQPGSLLPYRSIAYGCLFGLIGISLTSVAVGLFSGGSVFQLLHSIDLYGGLLLFTALNAIDTHTAIELYEKNTPDYLGCSITMMLNALNIFIRVLEILSKVQQNK